jgi:subtilisin-like proprotein convertase family protein
MSDHRVLAIPDLSTVSVPYANGCPGNGSAAATIAVDISHTYISDLVVDLIAPSGRVYNLHNRAGGSSDNLVKTYTLNLSGEPVEGIWTLRIQDAAAADTGQLNYASLTLQ